MEHKYTLELPHTLKHSKPEFAAPYAIGDDNPEEESICHECRQVDWDSLNTEVENWQDKNYLWGQSKPRLVRTIGANHKQLAASSCKICRILSIVKPRSLDDTECVVEALSLSKFSAAYAIPREWDECKIIALHVCPREKAAWQNIRYDNCLAVIRRDSPESSSKTIPPKLIDYDWLKRLAQSCEDRHIVEESCGSSILGPVSALKVIEVSSRTVIEAPAECKYVALSYVWGKQPEVTQPASSPLHNLPPLIEDVLSVTTAMGYKYLWIDKYCIPQTDKHEKHRMINQMGQVYENASLTIIQASAGDACVQSGLPGILSSTRRPQGCVYIRNTAILELPSGIRELKCSKWATRGWTYQEGFLSRRRLIFTPSQVLFLCNTIYAEESVCRLSQRVATAATFNPRFRGLFNASDRAMRGVDYVDTLAEYSKRQLTYSEDSLNAFLGVLNFQVDALRLHDPDSLILHISCGIVAQSRSPGKSLLVLLNWYHEFPTERRLEFPSWSWAGWGGPLISKSQSEIECFRLYDDRNFKQYDDRGRSHDQPRFDWEVSWENTENKAVTIWDLFDYYSNSTSYKTDTLQLHQKPDYPKRLDVTCFVVPIRFQVVPLTEMARNQETEIHFENPTRRRMAHRRGLPSESVPVLQFVKGVHIATKAYLDQDVHLEDCIVGLLYARQCSVDISIGCLLARQLNEGVYERVGAIPSLLYYEFGMCCPDPRDFGRLCMEFPQSAFLDDTGSILDTVRVSAAQEESLFCGIGERRTVSLV